MQVGKNVKIIKKISYAFLMTVLMLVVMKQDMITYAAETKTYTISMNGSYRDPLTQQIQDSGGESSEALGQSMVNSVVDGTGLLELDKTGNWYMSIRFHLMDNISNVVLSTRLPEDSTWTNVTYEVTSKTVESKDFRLILPGENAMVKAECYVEAMGRNVIFFVNYSNPIEGNKGSFMTLAPDENSKQELENNKSNELEKNVLTQETSVTMSDLSDVEGLIIGTNDTITTENVKQVKTIDQNENEKEDQTMSFSTNMGELQLNIDDSFWVILFGILFCAVFFADLIFLLGFYLIKKIISNKTRKNSSYRFSENEDDFSFQFMDDQDDVEDIKEDE